MFLTRNHQKLDVYSSSKKFVLACYRLSKHLPAEEKFGITSQIRGAALSVHLIIAEGASRKSEQERKRYCKVARGSVIEFNAALNLAKDLLYMESLAVKALGETMSQTLKILSGLIDSTTHH